MGLSLRALDVPAGLGGGGGGFRVDALAAEPTSPLRGLDRMDHRATLSVRRPGVPACDRIGDCLAFIAASIIAGVAIDRWRPISDALLIYGFIIAYAGAFALQFITDQEGDHTLLLGVLTLCAILGALAWAWYTDNRGALWVAYAVFSLEIFALYIKKIGTLLGTSVFFLMAGLMVAALAAVAYRLHSGTRARARTTP